MADNLIALEQDEKLRDAYKSKVSPSDDIDPELKKNKEWCIAWAESIWAKFLCNNSYTSVEQIRRMEELRLYGAGCQPRDKYMDLLIGDVNENPTREGWYNVNWDIFSPMPAYKRKVMGRLETQDHKVTVNAIDPLSGKEKEDAMWNALFKTQFSQIEKEVQQLAKIAPMNNEAEYIPESREELEAFNMVGGFKLKHEIGMEKAITYTDYISNIKEIKRKVNSDLIDIGCAATRDFVDVDGIEKFEYMDFARLIVDHDRETGFKKSRFWGYLKFYTISEVRSWRPDIPEENLVRMARTFANRLGNPIWTWDYQNVIDYRDPIANAYVYDNFRIAVLVCEFRSVDSIYKTKRTTKYGTTIYGKSEFGAVYDKPNKKTRVTTVPNVYFCDWIVGTTETLRHGQQFDIPKVAANKIPPLSGHFYALPGKSIVESVITPLDQVHLANLKLQNALANAAPAGLQIEYGALNNINLGDGDMTPLELINLKRATGDIIYRATTHAGKYNAPAGPPISQSEGGIGPLLNEIITIFEINLQFISEFSGIDRVSAVAQKPGETTATEAKLSVAATSDSIQPVYAAWISMKESMARNACDKIQIQIKYGDGYEAYYPVLGKSSMEVFKLSKDYADRTYGLMVEALPTAEFKNILFGAAQEALKPGKDGENISYGDYLMVVSMIDRGMLKQAQMVLNYRLNKRKQQAIQLQRENIQLQAGETKQLEDQKFKQQLSIELVKHIGNKELANDDSFNQLKKSLIEGYLIPTLSPQQGQQQENVA
jgi:hypothetical protein